MTAAMLGGADYVNQYRSSKKFADFTAAFPRRAFEKRDQSATGSQIGSSLRSAGVTTIVLELRSHGCSRQRSSERTLGFLTTTGAADTRGCQLCCPGNPSGGYTESGLRLSWSSREHRQSHHPTPYYGMRKAKFRRIARTGILMNCDELTQPPACSCVSITLPASS